MTNFDESKIKRDSAGRFVGQTAGAPAARLNSPTVAERLNAELEASRQQVQRLVTLTWANRVRRHCPHVTAYTLHLRRDEAGPRVVPDVEGAESLNELRKAIEILEQIEPTRAPQGRVDLSIVANASRAPDLLSCIRRETALLHMRSRVRAGTEADRIRGILDEQVRAVEEEDQVVLVRDFTQDLEMSSLAPTDVAAFNEAITEGWGRREAEEEARILLEW